MTALRRLNDRSAESSRRRGLSLPWKDGCQSWPNEANPRTIAAWLNANGRTAALRLLNQTGDPDQNHRADEGDNDGTDQAPTRRNAQQPE